MRSPGLVAEIDVDALAVVERQHAQIVDAVRVVGVLVRVEHRVDAIDVGARAAARAGRSRCR